MNGLAVDMRGGDACGRGDCYTGAVGPSLADELVQDIGLTGTGRTGQEHVRAGVQNGQGFGLAHINLSRLPSGRGAKYGGLLIEDAGGYDVGGDGLGCGIVRAGGGSHKRLTVVAQLVQGLDDVCESTMATVLWRAVLVHGPGTSGGRAP